MYCMTANAALDADSQARVRAATFEVVVPKPTEDPLTYEKPLPLDLLPYAERTDQYYSVGTAFSLGGGRYVTAAHVLQLSFGGVMGLPALRDNNGNVYSIAKIYKYSQHQDFVVFSLAKEPPGVIALPVNTQPVLNEEVYAVGNALGTGVVIRDGTYTSDTPEQQNGRWKWLRFSAPASPGNSGGPLLDKTGRVIGVVLMKSPNENLNYALRINEVLSAPDNEGRIAQRMEFRLAIFDATDVKEFAQQLALPLSLADFQRKYLNLYEEFESQELQALLQQEADSLFPSGSGSNELLHRFYRRSYPGLVYRNPNGIWRVGAETKPEQVDLPGNGRVTYGTMNHLVFFNMHWQQLLDDPASLDTLLLKAMPLHRPVGEQKIRITAFGKPIRDEAFDDHWGRHWRLLAWTLPFENAVFSVASSATPDGSVAFGRLMPASKAGADAKELKKLADFVYFAYSGTLQQWQKFLANKTLRPQAFADIEVTPEYGNKFAYRSARLNFAFTQDLQKIEPESVLWLYTGVVPEQNRAVFDVAALSLQATRAEKAGIDAYRYTPPGENLAAEDQDRWKELVEKTAPYNAVPFLQGNEKIVRTSLNDPSWTGSQNVLYALATWAPNNAADDVLKSRLDLLAKGMHITEH
jgi:hypothetical protein